MSQSGELASKNPAAAQQGEDLAARYATAREYATADGVDFDSLPAQRQEEYVMLAKRDEITPSPASPEVGGLVDAAMVERAAVALFDFDTAEDGCSDFYALPADFGKHYTDSARAALTAALARPVPAEVGGLVDENMVLWALGARVPEHVRARYGYAEHYSVGDYMAGDTNENRDVMRVALAAALAPSSQAGGEAVEHVGDTAFESWLSEYNAAGTVPKQRLRDAYWAGYCERTHPAPSAESAFVRVPRAAILKAAETLAAEDCEGCAAELLDAMIAAAPTSTDEGKAL